MENRNKGRERQLEGTIYRAPTSALILTQKLQKPSTSQALELPLASQMARRRRSGEGMAQPKSFSGSWRKGLVRPRQSTFKSDRIPPADDADAQVWRDAA